MHIHPFRAVFPSPHITRSWGEYGIQWRGFYRRKHTVSDENKLSENKHKLSVEPTWRCDKELVAGSGYGGGVCMRMCASRRGQRNRKESGVETGTNGEDGRLLNAESID